MIKTIFVRLTNNYQLEADVSQEGKVDALLEDRWMLLNVAQFDHGGVPYLAYTLYKPGSQERIDQSVHAAAAAQSQRDRLIFAVPGLPPPRQGG